MSLSTEIKATARSLGFSACGISAATDFPEDLAQLEQRVSQGLHADMAYLARDPGVRADVRRLVPGARSVISVLLNYYCEAPVHSGKYKISRYAWGLDYHEVIKEKLAQLQHWIEERTGVAGSRAGVDTGPVFEKRLAQQAGLGWIGKNNILINKDEGSWFFIGEIITTLELEYDAPETDHCGQCRQCLDACPTQALGEGHALDALKCLSYLTIKHKGPFHDSLPQDLNGYIYGCDICQNACPWNSKASPSAVPEMTGKDELLQMTDTDWEELTEEKFETLFQDSAAHFAGHERIIRNIRHNKDYINKNPQPLKK
jgi:epoxyqueuosine reductase